MGCSHDTLCTMFTGCYLCRNNNSKILYRIKSYSIQECLNCNFVYTTPVPSDKKRNNYYKQFDYVSPAIAEKVIRKDARRSLNIIDRLINKKNLLIDIGCGRGYFLDEASKRGWSCFGIDFSPKAISFGKDILKLDLEQADIYSFTTNKKFDVVILNQVIEHVYTPHRLLEKCYSILREQGIIYIATPNIESISARVLKNRFDHFIPPEHLGYFSRQTLTNLLEEIGFKVIYSGSWSYPQDLAGILKETLASKQTIVQKDIVCGVEDGSDTELKFNSIKRLKHLLFDVIFCGLFYRILNIDSFGINLEIAAIKYK